MGYNSAFTIDYPLQALLDASSEGVRVVKEGDLRSPGASRVGSIPTPRIFSVCFYVNEHV
jgi:hypothetical protein